MMHLYLRSQSEVEQLERLRLALRARSGTDAVRIVLALDPAKIALLAEDPGAVVGAVTQAQREKIADGLRAAFQAPPMPAPAKKRKPKR